MKKEEFEESVERALLMLPERIREMMDNIAVCVEERASDKQLSGIRNKSNLLGLYEGIPRNAWGRGGGNNLPDKITIFRSPIERISSSQEEMEGLIRDVVWHEVAHHFGFDEEGISKLEKRWKLKKIQKKN